jgi:glycosyltransferase involved in cell wall biosynthesis
MTASSSWAPIPTASCCDSTRKELPVRIAQIAPPWFPVPPTAYGGIELMVALLADGLVERGHDVTLFAPPGSRTKARLVSPLGHEPPRGSIGNELMGAIHAAGAFLRGEDFDIVHDHTSALGATIGAFSGHRVVHTMHDPFRELNATLFGTLGKRIWMVGISHDQRAMAPRGLRWAGVVHNGLAAEHYPYREDKEDYLLFLGRASADKGPELAIQAARRTGRRLVMLVKIDEEPERHYWAEHVQPLLTDHDEVHSGLGPQRKADLIARAGGMLFPIQWPEPFGLVMIESMACGTPVIAWRNGSVPEVIVDGETGYIVDSLDGMVEAIGKLDRLEPRAMRALVESKFSADAMVDGYVQAYDRVMAGQEG